MGRIGSTKLVLPKWHKYAILNRVIRVKEVEDVKDFLTKKMKHLPSQYENSMDMTFRMCVGKVETCVGGRGTCNNTILPGCQGLRWKSQQV